MIETVDSFQGKQLDVVILSCVRASEGRTGVGFLADVRRMNVAITRAKAALWVLGSAQTLKQSPVWAALLADAEARGVVIRNASARCTLEPDIGVEGFAVMLHQDFFGSGGKMQRSFCGRHCGINER